MSRILPTYSENGKPKPSAKKKRPKRTKRDATAPQEASGTKTGRTTKASAASSPRALGPVQSGLWAGVRLALPLLAMLPLTFAVDRRLALASGAMLAWCGGVALYAAFSGWRSGGLYLYGGFALAYAALTAYLVS